MPEPTDPWKSTLGDLWAKQSQYSKAASDHKTAQRSWNGPLILMGFVGVVASTTSPYLVAHVGHAAAHWTAVHYALTFVGPLLVAVSALLARELLGPKNEQKWIAMREVSEALKAEGYIFAAAAPPYNDAATAPDVLAKKITALVGDGADVLPPPKPDATKPHAPLDVAAYITARVDQQRIKYYEPSARENADSLRTWQSVTLALMIVSCVLGTIAGIEKHVEINAWIAVVSTALATVAAYVGASRFEFLAATYAATSQRLENLVREFKAKDRTPAERDRFILDCEATIAAQNRSWRNELTKAISEDLKKPARPTP